jgi:hypothetical protein
MAEGVAEIKVAGAAVAVASKASPERFADA